MIDNFPQKIIIHHSASEDGDYFNWQELRFYHISRGWQDIGYHFGIDRINEREEILIGRMPTMHGSHCPGWNKKSIGICLIGNFSKASPSVYKIEKAAELVAWLVNVYGFKVEDVEPHRKYKATECPGLYFDMEEFKNKVSEKLR